MDRPLWETEKREPLLSASPRAAIFPRSRCVRQVAKLEPSTGRAVLHAHSINAVEIWCNQCQVQFDDL